jgi:hypothetical protein
VLLFFLFLFLFESRQSERLPKKETSMSEPDKEIKIE